MGLVEFFEPILRPGVLTAGVPALVANKASWASDPLRWVDPDGARHELGVRASLGVQYGPGGGAVCQGAGCKTVNAAGQTLTGAGFLLYPTKDGKANVGYACVPGAVQCASSLERDGWKLRWQGVPDASWRLVVDPSYRRGSLGTATDRKLAELITGPAPRALLGDQVDRYLDQVPLPPLRAEDYHRLNAAEKARYEASLSPLSWARIHGAVLFSARAQSERERLIRALDEQRPELRDALTALRGATPDDLAKLRRSGQLDKHLKTLRGAGQLGVRLADAHQLVDGIDRATYLPKSSGSTADWLARDLKPIQEINAAEPLPFLPAGPTKTFTAPDMRERAAHYSGQVLGQGGPLAPRQPTLEAVAVLELSLIRPEQAMRHARSELDARAAALNARHKLLNRQSPRHLVEDYNADAARYLANVASFNAQSDTLRALRARMIGATAAADLPPRTPAGTPEQRRRLDLAYTKHADDPAWHARLASANAELRRVNNTMGSLAAGRIPTDVAAALRDYRAAAQARYDAVAGGSRAPHNRLGELPLPSTGRTDLLDTLVAVSQRDTWDELQALETGIPNSEIKTPRDRQMRANLMALRWFAGSRDRPQDWAELTSFLHGPERDAAEAAFQAGRETAIMDAAGKPGDWLMDLHHRYAPLTAAAMPDAFFPGGRELWGRIGEGGARAIASVPQGTVWLLDALGTEIVNDIKYSPFLGRAPMPDRLPGETGAEYHARVFPFTGIISKAGQDSWNRLRPILLGRNTADSRQTAMYGSWREGIYSGYDDDPVGTLLADLTIPALPALGAGLALKATGVSVRAGAAGAAGVRAVLQRGAGLVLTGAGHLLTAPAYLPMAPYLPWGAAGRLAAGGLGGVLPKVASAAHAASFRAAARAGRQPARWVPTGAWGAASGGLRGMAKFADSAAVDLQDIGRFGLFGGPATPEHPFMGPLRLPRADNPWPTTMSRLAVDRLLEAVPHGATRSMRWLMRRTGLTRQEIVSAIADTPVDLGGGVRLRMRRDGEGNELVQSGSFRPHGRLVFEPEPSGGSAYEPTALASGELGQKPAGHTQVPAKVSASDPRSTPTPRQESAGARGAPSPARKAVNALMSLILVLVLHGPAKVYRLPQRAAVVHVVDTPAQRELALPEPAHSGARPPPDRPHSYLHNTSLISSDPPSPTGGAWYLAVFPFTDPMDFGGGGGGRWPVQRSRLALPSGQRMSPILWVGERLGTDWARRKINEAWVVHAKAGTQRALANVERRGLQHAQEADQLTRQAKALHKAANQLEREAAGILRHANLPEDRGARISSRAEAEPVRQRIAELRAQAAEAKVKAAEAGTRAARLLEGRDQRTLRPRTDLGTPPNTGGPTNTGRGGPPSNATSGVGTTPTRQAPPPAPTERSAGSGATDTPHAGSAAPTPGERATDGGKQDSDIARASGTGDSPTQPYGWRPRAQVLAVAAGTVLLGGGGLAVLGADAVPLVISAGAVAAAGWGALAQFRHTYRARGPPRMATRFGALVLVAGLTIVLTPVHAHASTGLLGAPAGEPHLAALAAAGVIASAAGYLAWRAKRMVSPALTRGRASARTAAARAARLLRRFGLGAAIGLGASLATGGWAWLAAGGGLLAVGPEAFGLVGRAVLALLTHARGERVRAAALGWAARGPPSVLVALWHTLGIRFPVGLGIVVAALAVGLSSDALAVGPAMPGAVIASAAVIPPRLIKRAVRVAVAVAAGAVGVAGLVDPAALPGVFAADLLVGGVLAVRFVRKLARTHDGRVAFLTGAALLGAAVAVAANPLPTVLSFVAFAARGTVSLLRLAPSVTPKMSKLFTVVVPVTWLVNLAIHLPGALHALAGHRPVDLLVNGLFAVADVAFLARDLAAAGTTLLRTRDLSAHPRVAGALRWAGYPTITVAAVLLGAQLVFTGPLLAVPPLAALAGALGYLSLRNFRPASNDPSRGWVKRAAAVSFGGLAGYGLVRLWLDYPGWAAATTAALGTAALLTWILHGLRPPPGEPGLAQRNRQWRDAFSAGHRRWFLTVVSVASGILLTGLYATRTFTEAAGVAEGSLFIVALLGNVIGIFTLGPLWDFMPRRARAVAALVLSGAVYALFTVVSGPVGFHAAALVLGVVSSIWIKLYNQADAWADASNERRRERGEPVRWATTSLALIGFGLAAALATVLAAHGVLIHLGLTATALATTTLAGLAAVGLWLTTPSQPGQPLPSFSLREVGDSLLGGPLRALRNRFVLAVVAVYGFSAMMLGAFDELWPHALEQTHPAAWLTAVLTYGLIAGEVLIIVLSMVVDLKSQRDGPGVDYLARSAKSFTLTMAAVMAFGALSVVVTQHMLALPAVGIGLNAFLGEAGSVGLILAVNALLKRYLPDERERTHANNLAQQLKALSLLTLGALLASHIWEGRLPGLPGGWAGVSVQIGIAGTAALAAALAVFFWPSGNAPPPASPAPHRALIGRVTAGLTTIGTLLGAAALAPPSVLEAGVGVFAALLTATTAFTVMALRAFYRHRTGRGDGGPVVDGMDSAAARRVMLPLLPGLLAGARPLSDAEFPNLARGPPWLTGLVRITDADPLDGKLIGFGWRPDGAGPEHGVILVPARVAGLVDRLISHEETFLAWWVEFLRHEWDFHLNGSQHTGERHDQDAATLAARLRDARGYAGVTLRIDHDGDPVGLGWAVAPDTVLTSAAVLWELDETDARGVSRLTVAGDPVAEHLEGISSPASDLVALHVPGLHAIPVPLAAFPARPGDPVAVATLDDGDLPVSRWVTVTDVEYALSSAGGRVTLGMPEEQAVPGAPVFAAAGGVVGVVYDGYADVQFALPLGELGSVVRAARGARWGSGTETLELLQGRLAVPREVLERALPGPVRRAEVGLDLAADQLGPWGASGVPAHRYDATFSLLIELAHRAGGAGTDPLADAHADELAAVLRNADLRDERFDFAAAALGNPWFWRVHLRYDVADFPTALHAPRDPTGVRARVATWLLLNQLPVHLARAPTRLLNQPDAAGALLGELDLLAHRERHQPGTLSRRIAPALAVARHHLRRLVDPGRFPAVGLVAVAFWRPGDGALSAVLAAALATAAVWAAARWLATRRPPTEATPNTARSPEGSSAEQRDRTNRALLRAAAATGGPHAAGIAALHARLDAPDLPPAYLLGFDTNGRGHAIVAIRNPDTAAHVTVYVPGMGNHLGTVGTGIARADAMYAAAADTDLAVIAHWGFDQPQSPATAVTLRHANAAAPALHRFLRELRERRGPDTHLVLLAHSYGSVIAETTGRDPALGLRDVDDLIIVGSPGLRTPSATALGVRVWVVWISRDLFGYAPRPVFGTDPTRGRFGAKVIYAGPGGRFGGQFGVADPHMRFWDPGSAALRAIADLITGQTWRVRTVPGRGVWAERTLRRAGLFTSAAGAAAGAVAALAVSTAGPLPALTGALVAIFGVLLGTRTTRGPPALARWSARALAVSGAAVLLASVIPGAIAIAAAVLGTLAWLAGKTHPDGRHRAPRTGVGRWLARGAAVLAVAGLALVGPLAGPVAAAPGTAQTMTAKAHPAPQPATPARPNLTELRVPGIVVTVEPGDTLIGLATRHGTPGGFRGIVRANPELTGRDPDWIFIGERFVVPTGRGTTIRAEPQPNPEVDDPIRKPGPKPDQNPGREQPSGQSGFGSARLPNLLTALGAAVLAFGAGWVGQRRLGDRGQQTPERRAPSRLRRPVPPGHQRTWLDTLAWAGTAAGVGLALAAAGTIPTVLALALTMVSAALGARQHWSSSRIRGPPTRPNQFWRVARQVGQVLTGPVALAAGFALPEALRDLVGWWLASAATSATGKALLAGVLSATLAGITVWARKMLLVEDGKYAQPRKDATLSTAQSAFWNATDNILQMATLPVLVTMVQGHQMFWAAFAAAFGSFWQRRRAGWERITNAFFVAGYAAVAVLIVSNLGITQHPANWGQYFDPWLWLLLGAALLAPWTEDAINTNLVRVGKRTVRALERKARGSANRWWPGWWQRSLSDTRLDWDSRGAMDWAATAVSLDTLVASVLTYLVMRPMPGIDETVGSITLRVLGAAAILVATTWARGRLERALGLRGAKSNRSIPHTDRPWLPMRRLHRQIEPWWQWRPFKRTPFRELLATFLTHLDEDAVRKIVANPSTAKRHYRDRIERLDKVLSDESERERLAERIVEGLVSSVSQLPPEPDLLRRLRAFPGLEEQTGAVAATWRERHQQHLRAEALAILVLISNLEVLRGAERRLRGRTRDLVALVVLVLEKLGEPANLGELKLSDDDRAALERINGRALRVEWEKRLRQALDERKQLRLDYYENHLLPLLRKWRSQLSDAEARTTAVPAILRAEAQLTHEQNRKISGSALALARRLARQRHYSVADSIASERTGQTDNPSRGERLITFARLDSTMRLLHALLAIKEEIELHRVERAYWRSSIRDALKSGRDHHPHKLLATLLYFAGAAEPVSTATLVRHLRHTAPLRRSSARKLARRQIGLLLRIGALEAVTQPNTAMVAYRASEELMTLWRAADPRLRHAVWVNPTRLPSGEPLEPLTRWLPPRAPPAVTEHAYTALLDLLATHQRVRRHHSPGFWDDLHRARHWLLGRIHQRHHPLSRVESPPSPATPSSDPARELREKIRETRRKDAHWHLAEWQTQRAPQQSTADTALTETKATPAETTLAEATTTEAKSFAEATTAVLTAYQQLRHLVEDITTAHPDPRKRPIRLARRLLTARRLLAHEPSHDPQPPIPPVELRQAHRALRLAQRSLARAARLGHRADTEAQARAAAQARTDAQFEAWVAVRRFQAAYDVARVEKLAIRWGPSLRLKIGRRTADRLATRTPAFPYAADEHSPAPPATESTSHSVSITNTDRPDPTRIQFTLGEDQTVITGDSSPDTPGGHNLDAVAARFDPTTHTITAVIAQGARTESTHSWWAARTAVDIIDAELHRSGDTPHAHLTAFATAAARIAALAPHRQAHHPKTEVIAVRVTPNPGGTARVDIASIGRNIRISPAPESDAHRDTNWRRATHLDAHPNHAPDTSTWTITPTTTLEIATQGTDNQASRTIVKIRVSPQDRADRCTTFSESIT